MAVAVYQNQRNVKIMKDKLKLVKTLKAIMEQFNVLMILIIQNVDLLNVRII